MTSPVSPTRKRPIRGESRETAACRPPLLAVLFPERCAYCGQVVRCGEGCCPCCAESLPRILPPVCPLCGRGKASCTCRGHRGPLDGLAAPFTYEGAVRQGILRLKEEGDATAAATLAAEMADAVRRAWPEAAPELAVPVPSPGANGRVKASTRPPCWPNPWPGAEYPLCEGPRQMPGNPAPEGAGRLAAQRQSAGRLRRAPRTPLAGKCVLLLTTSPPLGLRWRNVPKC